MGIFGDILNQVDGAKDRVLDTVLEGTGDQGGLFRGGVDDVLLDTLNIGGNVLQGVADVGKPLIGQARYGQLALRENLGLPIPEEDWLAVQAARQAGGDDWWKQGRSVWENEIVSGMPMWQRAIADTAVDPTTWAGLGAIRAVGGGVKALGAADDASRLMRGVSKLGAPIEKAGVALNAPDKYIFDPAINALAVKPIKGAAALLDAGARKVAPGPSKTIDQALEDLHKKARRQMVKWTALSPKEKFRENAEWVSGGVSRLLNGGDLETSPAAREGTRNAYLTTMQSDVAAERKARQLANEKARSQAARETLGYPRYLEEDKPLGMTLFSGTGKAAPSRGQTDIILESKSIWRRLRERAERHLPGPHEKGSVFGIVPGATGVPQSEIDSRTFGVPVETSFGTILRYASNEERETLARAAAKMILEEARTQGSMRSYRFALEDIQRIGDEFISRTPGARALWPDIYKRAKEIIESEEGIRLPSVMYAGTGPTGGGLDLAKATDEEKKTFVENTASAIVQALRKGGLAKEFAAGGAYYESGSMRPLVEGDGLGEGGLQIATFSEFYDAFAREFGDVVEDDAREMYALGVERFRKNMVTAVNRGTSGVNVPGVFKGQYDFSGMLPNADEYMDLVKRGEAGLGFYSDALPELRREFESDGDYRAFLQILAATSANTPVDQNVTRAIDAWIQWKIGNREVLHELGFEDEFISSLGRQNFAQQQPYPDHRESIFQAMRGEFIETQKLRSYEGSFKDEERYAQIIEAFEYDPSLGMSRADQEAMQAEVLDSIMRSSGFSTGDIWNQRSHHMPDQPTPDEYQAQEAFARYLANETNIPPQRIQESSWAGKKFEVGYKPTESGKAYDAGAARNVVSRIEASGAKNFDEFLRKRAVPMVQEWMQNAANSIRATVRDAEKVGQTVWTPNLKGNPTSGKTPPEDLSTKVSGKKKTRDIAFRGPGVHVVSHRIRIPEGTNLSDIDRDSAIVRDLMKFKLRMDDAFEPAWLNTRVIMDIDQPDGSINLDVFYYPEGAGVDRLQSAIDRVNRTASDTDDQFANARRILPKVARIDRRARSLSKNSGRNLKNAVSGIDSIAARFDEDTAFEGMSFKITEDGMLQEWPETPRYVVALNSAGGGSLPKKMAAKSRRAAIDKFIKDMEPVWNGVDEDKIIFGVFEMPDKQSYSVDMNYVTDNLDEAKRVGEATNQVSIYDSQGTHIDPVTGEEVEGGFVEDFGGEHNSKSPLTTSDQVNQFLDELVVGQPGTPSSASLGITAGSGIPVTGDPIAQANIVAGKFLDSRLGREVAGRLGLGYNEVAEGVARQGDEYLTMLKQSLAELNDTIDPPDGVFWLSKEENQRLFNTTFTDGESIGSYALRTRDELQAEQDALIDAGIFWDGTESRASAVARAQDDELKKIVGKWHDNGINPNDDINRAVDQIIQKRLAKESGLPVDQRGVYDKMKAIWSEQVLASGRYVMANLTTNVLDALMTGHFNLGSGADVYKLASADIKRIDPEDIITSTKAYEVLSKYGLGDSLAEISTAQGTRAMAGTVRRGSQTRALLDTVKLGSLAKVVELPMAMAQGIDTNSRLAMFTDVLERVFHERRPELLAKVDSVAMDAGIDTTGVDMLPSYDPSYLYGHYKALGMGDGHAERAARHVAELRNEARKEAIKEINRVFLSYRKTNLDEALGKVIPFHYWASRKLRFYAEEAYRNPWLISAYWRSLQGIERAQEDPGLNARQKGFLRLMSGPAGFSLLMNPDALLGVIKASQLDMGYPAENESGIGGVLRVLKQQGVGLYPWIDGAMNLMGVYGDTFEPDMLGIRHRALVGGVVNWMRGEGLLGESNRDMGAAPYADAMLSAREEVSSWVSSFTPDWLSQPVKKKAGGSIGNATMDDIIEVRIIEENPSLTNLELARIMNDPDSPEYQSAFQDVARAGVLKQLLNFSMPVSFRVDSDKRDVESAQRTEISKEADRLGVMPWEVNNGNASLEFKAQYEKQTGKQFSVKDWETTSLEREVRRADPQARRFVVLENEYQSIIPDAIKPYVDTFWGIRQGRMSPPGYQGSLAGQPQQVLDWYADRYLESVGQRDNVYTHINLQQQFRESNPDFQQFKDWQGQMFTLQAAYGGSLDEYRRVISNQNPAAAAFFNRELQHIQDRGIPPEQWGPELDQVTTSSSAWFAIHGQPMMQTDFARTSDVGTGDVMPEMMAPIQGNMNSQPTPPSEDWVSVYNSRR